MACIAGMFAASRTCMRATSIYPCVRRVGNGEYSTTRLGPRLWGMQISLWAVHSRNSVQEVRFERGCRVEGEATGWQVIGNDLGLLT